MIGKPKLASSASNNSWPHARIEALLRRSPWFAGLPPSLAQLLIAAGQVQHHGRGEIIVAAEQSMGLGAVLRGMVALSKVGAVGNEIVFYVARPGFWFGTVGVLLDRPVDLIATAASDTTTFLVPRGESLRLLARHAALHDAVARLAHDRFLRALEALEHTSRPSTVGRVAAKLLSIRDLDVATDPSTADAPLAISQSVLALMTSLSRQSVSMALRSLADAGAIALGFKAIRIVDAAQLEAIANSPDLFRQPARRRKSSSR